MAPPPPPRSRFPHRITYGKSATAGAHFYRESAPTRAHFSEILSIRRQSMIWGRRKLSKRFCFPQNHFCIHCFPVGGLSENIPLDCLSIFFLERGVFCNNLRWYGMVEILWWYNYILPIVKALWNSDHMVQAAQEDAQKSQNLLYHISLTQSNVIY